MSRSPAFLVVSLGTAALILAGVMSLNYLVDPLWHFGGNKLAPVNFVFDERRSKLNILWPRRQDYDCYILGSSRATLLHQGDIKRFRCFNLAFSAATPPELLAYARYLARYVPAPRAVIVAVDMRNFSRPRLARRVPGFVDELRPPPGPLAGLVSLDAALFSLRTLAGHSPYARYYDGGFDVRVLPGTRPMPVPDCYASRDAGRPYAADRLEDYRRLRRLFPRAELIGYTAPVSAWDMTVLAEDGSLDSYARVQYAVSRLFDRYYDFAIPSPVTADAANSYDADHFLPRVTRRIAATIDTDEPAFGLALHRLDEQEYAAALRRAIDDFRRGREPVRLARDCGRLPAVR